MKKTRFLFDSPIIKDWLFYVFLFILTGNIINGLSNVSASGGFVSSFGGITSGLIDGAARIFLAWFPLVPIVYVVRKAVRKRNFKASK